tara:strand:- start:1094 stop:2425 length:1332 start_codon:yes stop_codon:yes gene_type:complete
MSLTHSIEAEQSVLGSILLDEDMYASCAPIISANDFSDPVNKKVWLAITECDEKDISIDMVTVASVMGMEYMALLGDLSAMTPSTANAPAYAQIIADKAKYRRLAGIGSGIDLLMEDNAKSEEIEEYIGKQLQDATGAEGNKTQSSIGQAIKKLIQRTDDRFNGKVQLYSTGLIDLDSALQLEPGRMMVIAGRPGTGKSTLAQNIIEHNCKQGIPCYSATMEMPEEEVAARMVCSQGGVNSKFLQDPEGYTKTNAEDEVNDQWTKLSVGVNASKDWPLMIDYCPGLKIGDFKRRVRAFFHNQPAYKDGKKGIMCIDYLGLMGMDGDNRVQGLGALTKALKTFAGEMGIPLLLLAQLNRGVEQRPNKRPMNSDLRDSGEIEEDADIIAFLYRDELYNEDSQDKGIAEIILGKNRGGEPTTIRAAADLKHYRFKNLAPEFYSQNR